MRSPFLDEDYHSSPSFGYPYPAKMPSFIAKLGIKELELWDQTAQVRKDFLCELLSIFKKFRFNNAIPASYFDSKREIIPLRLAWSQKDGAQVRKKLSGFIDVSWTWFMQPIVAVNEPLEQYGYKWESCPNSELVGPNMINLPCNIDPKWSNQLNKIYKKLYSKN